jgi:pimeloyl-ACP methyl ester carboxylesterase
VSDEATDLTDKWPPAEGRALRLYDPDDLGSFARAERGPIFSWHFVISGFTQREGESNGWGQLWRKLNYLSNDGCCVEFKTWRQRWSDVADLVEQWRPQNRDPVVKIYGYSFGGMSAVILASELKRRGIGVRHLLLADAVYRCWTVLGWWRSMVPFSRIVVPENVEQVDWFRQKHSRFALFRDGAPALDRFAMPAGNDVVAENPRFTKIAEAKRLDCEHTFVCRAPEVHRAAIDIAERS